MSYKPHVYIEERSPRENKVVDYREFKTDEDAYRWANRRILDKKKERKPELFAKVYRSDGVMDTL